MGLNKEQMEAMNRVSLPGAVNGEGLQGPQRPTQLSLAPPTQASGSTSAATSPSPTPSTPADSGPATSSIGMPLSPFFALAFASRFWMPSYHFKSLSIILFERLSVSTRRLNTSWNSFTCIFRQILYKSRLAFVTGNASK